MDIICDKMAEGEGGEGGSHGAPGGGGGVGAGGAGGPNLRGGPSTGATRLTDSSGGGSGKEQSCQC